MTKCKSMPPARTKKPDQQISSSEPPLKRASGRKTSTPYPVAGTGNEVTAQVVSKSFSGPLPPPDDLKKYGEVGLDIPNRIVTMAEKEQEHQHRNRGKTLEYIRRDNRRKQTFGLLISLAALATAGFCAWIGAPWIIVLGTILPGLSSVFYLLLDRYIK